MQPVLDEHFVSWAQSPEQMDSLWERGWRHFGPIFYRYREVITAEGVQHVLPLRIQVKGFAPSKSQRRVLRKNTDVEIRVKRAEPDLERQRLFDLHKQRFKENVPNSLEDFLGPAPQAGPCLTIEVGGFLEGKLIAASYLDVGEKSVSSIYAFFDPQYNQRSLGTATMLWELIVARRSGKIWHYPGYCYHEPSGYDYKLGFGPMETYDWEAWRPKARGERKG
jgi:arginyl-tRNA--protein-N-Asp/Glu arginylyltransferase